MDGVTAIKERRSCWKCPRDPVSEDIIGKLLEAGCWPCTWPSARSVILERTSITAALAEPLLYRDRLVGVLKLDNRDTGRTFTEQDRDVLRLFPAQAAIPLENARLFAAGRERRAPVSQLFISEKAMPRVLVVDDEPDAVELLQEFLTAKGYAVLTASNGEEALRLAGLERPHLILMDLQISGMTGYEATQKLKADPATAAIPVVALTAQAMRGDEARGRQASCDAYITKPLDAEVFRETLRRFLLRREAPAGL